jgi:hypothetical protein
MCLSHKRLLCARLPKAAAKVLLFCEICKFFCVFDEFFVILSAKLEEDHQKLLKIAVFVTYEKNMDSPLAANGYEQSSTAQHTGVE